MKKNGKKKCENFQLKQGLGKSPLLAILVDFFLKKRVSSTYFAGKST